MTTLRDTFHSLLGSFLFKLPHNQQKWEGYMYTHEPILAPALKNNPYARLLVLRTLDSIHRKRPSAAASKRLYKLHFCCHEDSHPDRALYNFLCGLYSELRGYPQKMASRFRLANKFGHTYYLIHMKLGFYYLTERHAYSKAEEELTHAIDCVYAHPPITQESKELIGLLYAGIAASRVMMHRNDDASDALRIAGNLNPKGVMWLSSQALYHAAMHDPTQTQHYLSLLDEQNSEFAQRLRKQADLILADQHPHFISLPIGSPEETAEFWRVFLENEQEMQHLIDEDKRQAAVDLYLPLLKKADVYEDDYWGHSIDFLEGHYRFVLRSNYSRTYTPWIAAIIAACPPELHERWQIIHEP